MLYYCLLKPRISPGMQHSSVRKVGRHELVRIQQEVGGGRNHARVAWNREEWVAQFRMRCDKLSNFIE